MTLNDFLDTINFDTRVIVTDEMNNIIETLIPHNIDKSNRPDYEVDYFEALGPNVVEVMVRKRSKKL